jgi:hypothetical protein
MEKNILTTPNNTYKKLAVQWLNEHLCFVSSVVLADNFVLRNRQLLKPAKRYRQPCETDSVTIDESFISR